MFLYQYRTGAGARVYMVALDTYQITVMNCLYSLTKSTGYFKILIGSVIIGYGKAH